MDIGSEHHPDPFRDAMQDAVYRAVQVGSFAVTATQVYAYHRRAQARITAEQDQQARRALNAQIRAERDADRARWAARARPRLAAPRRPHRDRASVGRRAALHRPRRALVRASRRHRHDPMRGTAPQPAPLRHGPLRPAPQRRARPSRGDAGSRPAVRPPSPGPGRVRPCRARCWRPHRRPDAGPASADTPGQPGRVHPARPEHAAMRRGLPAVDPRCPGRGSRRELRQDCAAAVPAVARRTPRRPSAMSAERGRGGRPGGRTPYRHRPGPGGLRTAQHAGRSVLP